MTFPFSFPPLQFSLPLAATAFALGCSAVAGDTEVAGRAATAVKAPALPALACGVSIRKAPLGYVIEGQVQSAAPMTGDYDLKIAKSGRSGHATIRQSGHFSARPGRTETLGTTTMNGRRSDFDVEMSVTVDGKRARCGGALPIDL